MSDTKPLTLKYLLPYVAIVLVFGLGIWLIVTTGARQYSQTTNPSVAAPQNPSAAQVQATPKRSSPEGILAHLKTPFVILLLQLVVIIIAARVVGRLFTKIGQPPVMGEIVAGIVLGPSLLGWLSPATMGFLFPPSSMEALRLLSQIGVSLFMFVVGMELDVQHLRQKAHTAIVVSHASIIVPFFLGTALSFWLYRTLAPAGTPFVAFALFMGIVMSITAFPVLARILDDRRMSKTKLGSIALTCAAIDDVSAWCILAFVIAVAQSGSVAGSLITVALVLVFIFIMLWIVKPLLARLVNPRFEAVQHGKEPGRELVAGILALTFASALTTEIIGIHALFGAFLAGVVMPQTAGLRERFKERIEPFVGAALLPLFFAFTGLRMQVTLLNDWQSWAIAAVIVAVAIAGKLCASMLMARWCGMMWRDSFALGVLMNTRGLVELIVLNIGYDLGILSARLFAMLVLMALATTFMTGPLLALVNVEKEGGSGK